MKLINFYIIFNLIIKNFAKENQKLVVYWGQNSYGASHLTQPDLWERPIYEYCENDSVDVIVVAFLNVFNAQSKPPSRSSYKKLRHAKVDKSGENWKPPEMNLSYHCNTTFTNYPNVLNCPKIANDIKRCQSEKGKKILLSLGGASGAYFFNSESEATDFAETIWNMFLGGSSYKLNYHNETSSTNEIIDFPRPFGDTVLDGVDLDIEGGSGQYWSAFNKKLKSLYDTSASRKYIIAGAPQCPYPDGYFGSVLFDGWFDMLFVQFYNNFCGLQNFQNPYAFNYHEWDNWKNKKSKNPNVELMIGIPGSPQASNSGYLKPDQLYPIFQNITNKYNSFGGIMIWDASTAANNYIERDGYNGKDSRSVNFLSQMSDILKSKYTPPVLALSNNLTTVAKPINNNSSKDEGEEDEEDYKTTNYKAKDLLGYFDKKNYKLKSVNKNIKYLYQIDKENEIYAKIKPIEQLGSNSIQYRIELYPYSKDKSDNLKNRFSFKINLSKDMVLDKYSKNVVLSPINHENFNNFSSDTLTYNVKPTSENGSGWMKYGFDLVLKTK